MMRCLVLRFNRLLEFIELLGLLESIGFIAFIEFVEFLELLGFIGLLEFLEFILSSELHVSSYELLIPHSAICIPKFYYLPISLSPLLLIPSSPCHPVSASFFLRSLDISQIKH